MEIDDSSKVFIIPDGETSFKILHLPFGDVQKSVLVTEKSIFELREITGFSSFEAHPEPKLPSGGAVKSFIFENKDSSNQGSVLRSPNVIACSKFNLIFFIIRLMYQRADMYSSRYQTFSDTLDNFQGSQSTPEWIDVLGERMREPIKLICDSIEENGEEFYKFSLSKVINFLAEKVDLLKSLLLASPNSALARKIRSSLHSSISEPPADIVELQTLRFAVDLIFESYLTESLKLEFLKTKNIDFVTLTDYLHSLEKKLKEIAAVESNMTSVVESTTKARGNGKQALKSKKKVAKKVAVGKGALDSFFGKK